MTIPTRAVPNSNAAGGNGTPDTGVPGTVCSFSEVPKLNVTVAGSAVSAVIDASDITNVAVPLMYGEKLCNGSELVIPPFALL